MLGYWLLLPELLSTSTRISHHLPKFLVRPIYRLLTSVMLAVAGFTLSGCSTEADAIFRSVQYAYDRSAGPLSTPLNPNYRYLRATVDGRVVLLVLGYVENDADGPVEVWYSADREVIRLQNGRVVGAVGFSPEWREVVTRGAPSWLELVRRNHSLAWTRVRDVMPGYHSGIVDNLVTNIVRTARGTSLVGVDPGELIWFEDVRIAESGMSAKSLISANFDNEIALPPARYGVSTAGGIATVVYGEQCLSQTLCFTWQRWPNASPVKTTLPTTAP